MEKTVYKLICLVLLILISSCSPIYQVRDDILGPRYEAKTYLESNPNPYAFAGNRFASTKAALLFVELLYEYGAAEVFVSNVYDEDWRIESEGGPYADTLIIRLPSDPAARKDLFRLGNEEMRQEGFAPERDTGQDELLLWWD